MGQCMSRKAAGAFAVSAATAHQKRGMHRHQPLDDQSPNDDKQSANKRAVTKGVAMSFGFRKRPVTSTYTGNPIAARRLASADIDRNGNNGAETEPLTANAVPSGRTTPRLAPPKKEPNASRVSRFGFRQTNANRLNKIADINAAATTQTAMVVECKNNNVGGGGMRAKVAFAEKIASPVDSNKNDGFAYSRSAQNLPSPTKYTLQSSNLPKPQYAMHVVETKAAKTLVNTSRKVTHQQEKNDETSSKDDGSLTEDSGVDTHLNNRGDVVGESPDVRRLKQRALDVVLTGNTFDVRDLDEANDPVIPLPRLPSAFPNNTGIVRERALEYERNLDSTRNRRKISSTSSDGDDNNDGEEKNIKEAYRTEKIIFSKPTPIKLFLKSTKQGFQDNNSPPSSDDQLWGNAGEAMADDFSCSFSSSDESKDKEALIPPKTTTSVADAFETLMTGSLTNSLPRNEIRSVLLTIEDPKFAAVAAASKSSILLDDETSPTDSLVCSYSESQEESRRKLNQSSSASKDINEKLTLSPSSPGTPTNASNSLSLSDGKDFLIDDEIADQPALVFDETLTGCSNLGDNAQQNSENNTLVESTPKVKRKVLPAFEQSPLLSRSKKTFLSRTDSVETLSTCESIASDDLMMDYDVSQGSGADDAFDRSEKRSSLYLSEDGSRVISDYGKNESREWTTLFGNLDKALPKHVSRTSRLLRSRGGTPNSNPDSPRSIEGTTTTSNSRTNLRSRSSVSQSPLRLSRITLASSTGGYDSDDSIKLDRTCHSAMVQEVMGMKTMLLKLKRVLHESETHNPFDLHKNGLFNGLSSETDSLDTDDGSSSSRLELQDLKRQVLFLQGQVEDRERAVQELQEQMSKLINENYVSKSAPASTVSTETCNAATQTERTRPISAGPSLLHTNSPADGSMASLVSASESPRRSRLPSSIEKPPHSVKQPTSSRLWRKPGEPASSPQRYNGNNNNNNNKNNNISNNSTSPSSIPKRSCSRTRASLAPS